MCGPWSSAESSARTSSTGSRRSSSACRRSASARATSPSSSRTSSRSSARGRAPSRSSPRPSSASRSTPGPATSGSSRTSSPRRPSWARARSRSRTWTASSPRARRSPSLLPPRPRRATRSSRSRSARSRTASSASAGTRSRPPRASASTAAPCGGRSSATGSSVAVAEDDRELELVALARLGLGGRLGPDSGSASGEPLLDSLVRSGALARHQARAVRAYVARFEVRCSCGKRALASESTRALPCPGCGAALVRESSREVWTARPARPLPGTGSRIGPLELLEALGKGATATVYRARHTVLGRTSAVKVIPLAALDARKRRRFEREMKAVGRLRHPGIVPIHAAFEVGDALACEMDLVPGRTLEEVAADAGLPWREAAEMVARIAEAVSHAHRAGVLHRDLKPPNVLVRETDRAPFVVDFGLARLTDEASSLTRVGAFVGTPLYMAPEAFRGESTEATDIYGLGAILYYALTGHPPFEAASPEVLLYRVSRGLCEKTAASGAPADLERVRAQAMAVDPDDRFATAAEMASDLRRILGGAPIRAEPRRVSRRRRAILAGVAAVALVALATRSLVAPGAGEREAPVASVADALSVLASGKQGAARRAEALHVLTAASAIDLAALDSAVALAPSDEELRALR